MTSIPLSVIGRELENGKRIGGPGRLNVVRVNTIQSIFGKAIRRKKGHSNKMAVAG